MAGRPATVVGRDRTLCAKEAGQPTITEQSSTFNKFCFSFQISGFVSKRGSLKASGSKVEAKFCTFCPFVKLGKGRHDVLVKNKVGPTTEPLVCI